MSVSPSDIRNLEIQAVTFASLCAVAGVYFTLFVLALCSTFRKPGRSYKNFRIVTVVLFVAVSTHFIARSLDFNRARVIPQPIEELYTWTMPLRVVESASTTIAGLLSNGLLAYRFWFIYDRKPWALYVPSIAVILTTLLGLAQTFVNVGIYRHRGSFAYAEDLSVNVLTVSAAWGWSMFAVNTSLTLAILVKIISVNRACKSAAFVSGLLPYGLIVEAVIESAMSTWFGLLLYEIASLAPEGHYTTNLDIGYVAICILPFFFGISQCLITARLGFLTQENESQKPLSDPVFAASIAHSAIQSLSTRELVRAQSEESQRTSHAFDKSTICMPDDIV